MMRAAILIAAIGLAACSPDADSGSGAATTEIEPEGAAADGPPPQEEPPVETGGPDGAAPSPPPTPSPTTTGPPLGGLPPADSPNRYVGRWAATQQLCDGGAWRFYRERLVTAGEVSCSFDDVDRVAGGYDIAASCLAEGDTSEDTIELRFAESARAMLVNSAMWDGVGLIYCGPVE